MTSTAERFLQARRGRLGAGGRSARRRSRRRKTKVSVGYLHTLAVDGQIWLGKHRGALREARPRARARCSSRPASSCSRR